MSCSPSPTASEKTVTPPQRHFSRLPGPDFGDRLANARNLAPTAAPPPPPRAPSGNIQSTAWGSFIGLEDGGVALPTSMITPVIHGVQTHGPKYGGEKGSYRSPYDYNIAGHVMGGKNTTRESDSLHATPRVDSLSLFKKELVVTKPKSIVERPPAGTPERVLYLGPLRMMRRQCELRENIRPFGTWLDKHMGEELHTVVEKDALIPSIVYRVSIPMTEEHWHKYNIALGKFLLPRRFHDMLAGGEDNFNFFSGSTSPFVSPALQMAYSQIVHTAMSEMDIDSLHAELVKYHKGMWTTQGAGYEGGPGDTQG